MQWLIQTANDAGWLANLLGIVGFMVTCTAVFYRVVRPRIQPSRIDAVVSRDFASRWSPSMAKAWARIAIVDDQPNDFPIADLRSDGYQVQVYKQATLSTTAQLATYDIVFLDMKGIVKDDPELGGLKLIAELRKTNPTQKICAVSSKTFDPTATEFFRQANDYKKKPLTAQECRSVIEAFLSELFPFQALISAATTALDTLPRSSRVKVLREAKQFLLDQFDATQFQKRLLNAGLDTEQSRNIVNLVRAVISATP
jgi:DNA-binding response OmpR family regulator